MRTVVKNRFHQVVHCHWHSQGRDPDDSNRYRQRKKTSSILLLDRVNRIRNEAIFREHSISKNRNFIISPPRVLKMKRELNSNEIVAGNRWKLLGIWRINVALNTCEFRLIPSWNLTRKNESMSGHDTRGKKRWKRLLRCYVLSARENRYLSGNV